jgi:hypothetical protein
MILTLFYFVKTTFMDPGFYLLIVKGIIPRREYFQTLKMEIPFPYEIHDRIKEAASKIKNIKDLES